MGTARDIDLKTGGTATFRKSETHSGHQSWAEGPHVAMHAAGVTLMRGDFALVADAIDTPASPPPRAPEPGIRIEPQRRASAPLTWPLVAADQCALWMRGLLN
ncbi:MULTISPECIES: hypothetical protein [Comamonadaceae]|jgi:hypothetical protein|uniref:Uncharacterized protein n=1 Tax=Hydrogenophaga electricum TaxID=1230953 RepID=A0ABQ6C5I7_9BURK|nr:MULTISPECIES: hypothetical protein [Comamonadaceae]MCO5336981.1 hypothetical protein [Delftia tsuruhatensis]GLS13452.1 hypothetical protein GCM10007935_08810 [Hydrogenophaga electricum]